MEHHVYFWLNEANQRDEDLAAFEAGLSALFQIDVVAGGIWGTPAPTPARPVTDHSWDYALSLKFDSLADHDTYQAHPQHDLFLNRFKSFWKKVEVRDLKLG